MKIKYLGTAAAEGWPAMFCDCNSCRKAKELGGKNIRTRSQVIIDNQLLVDFPPDSYLHMLRDNLPMNKIASLIITHSHQDHFYPEELLMRGAPYAHNLAEVLTVYGNDLVEKEYERVLKMNDSPNLKEKIQYKEVTEFVPFKTVEGYIVTPLLACHSTYEKCLIYLIEKEGKCMLYSNDTGLYPDATWHYIKGKKIDLVSFDCTFVGKKVGTSHMGLPDNRVVKKKLAELGCTTEKTKYVVTHFSHNGALMHDEIVAETEKDGFLVAYDGYTVEI